MTTAKDIMHPGADWIPAHETLDRAAQLMRDLDVGALPVADTGERLAGIMTDRDIVVGCVAQGHDPCEGHRGRDCARHPAVDRVVRRRGRRAAGDAGATGSAGCPWSRTNAGRHDQRGRPGTAPSDAQIATWTEMGLRHAADTLAGAPSVPPVAPTRTARRPSYAGGAPGRRVSGPRAYTRQGYGAQYV